MHLARSAWSREQLDRSEAFLNCISKEFLCMHAMALLLPHLVLRFNKAALTFEIYLLGRFVTNDDDSPSNWHLGMLLEFNPSGIDSFDPKSRELQFTIFIDAESLLGSPVCVESNN
ncbi:hypothetical protein RJT34_32504 [Clitoria ternatea]|uniref:Uncharacterized protein n=1 Tax=Clitoria ternatea TaxID=43366 RepID=A0AAN9EX33_CLITE